MEYIEQNRTTSNKIEQNRTSRRIKFDIGSVIVLTEKFGFDFVRLPNIIEFNRSITLDCLPREHRRFQDERPARGLMPKITNDSFVISAMMLLMLDGQILL